MIADVKNLIKGATGYDFKDSDVALLGYIYQGEVQHVLNSCNLKEIPDELQHAVDEMAAGRFMQMSKAAILSADELDVVKSIKEGDTTVELGGTSAEQRLDALITLWTKERDLGCFRRLRW